MIKRIALLIASGSMLMFAADPAGFLHWTASEMKESEKKQPAPREVIGNHSFTISHREASGGAEIHENQTDIFVVQSGEATLVVGGEIPGSKVTAPGEVRGPKIEGGTQVKLLPGDVVNVPAKTPHQMIIEPGKQLTLLVVKVETK